MSTATSCAAWASQQAIFPAPPESTRAGPSSASMPHRGIALPKRKLNLDRRRRIG
jgi:hypothetical protein